jgi:hypothetical protein
MMTGAWIAASMDRKRLSRIKGYGSHALPLSETLMQV